MADAEDLIMLVGRQQYTEHPDVPGRPWFKITLSGATDFQQHLEYENLGEVSAKLEEAWQRIVERRKQK